MVPDSARGMCHVGGEFRIWARGTAKPGTVGGTFTNWGQTYGHPWPQIVNIPPAGPPFAPPLVQISVIAEICTRVRGADKNTCAPCDATVSGVFRQQPDLLPVFYPDIKKEFSEVRSGSEIGKKSHFCPKPLQPQAFPAEASQTMKQSNLCPKSAIAEISTKAPLTII